MSKGGFNLIALMVAVALIGVLATFAYLAINPAERLADLNAAKRLVQADSIKEAINRYAFINKGLPTSVDNLTNRQAYVLVPDGSSYTNLVSCNSILGYLSTTTISDFSANLSALPTDPSVSDLATYGSGYYLATINDVVYTGSCYQQYDLNNGLVAHWKFDESSWNGTVDEVKDWTNYHNDGQAVGGVTNSSANFKVGSKAYSGNGTTKYVSFPYDASLNLTSAFTMAGWIYPAVTTRMVVMGRGYAWELYTNNTALGLYLKRGVGDGAGDRYVQCSSNVGLTTNQWQHVAATFQPGVVKFYVNGVLKVTRTDTGCADYGNCVPALALHSVTSGSGEIGIYWGHASWQWNGGLDELAIWNRVLSDNEIATVYNLQANSFLKP